MKLFVNLCSDPAIALPAMTLDAQGAEQLRVPISAGPVALDVEKDGATPCLVCDVVLNPDTVARAQREKDFRAFIAGFALQKLQEKYKCGLAVDDIKFPKMRYKGPTPPAAQHIRRPKGAHIEPENPHGDDREQQSDERLEERRRAAQLARIEALRVLEERESGIVMGSSSGNRAATGDVFTSTEAAQAAMAAEHSRSPLDRFAAAKEPAKIEVLQDEPAPPRPQQAHAAPAASSAAAAAASTAATPVAAVSAATAVPTAASAPPPSSDPSLPSHSICYLKGSGTEVPASDWDLDLDPPSAVRVQVLLPLVSRSSAELEVEITRLGVTIYSKPECADRHKYQLHVSASHTTYARRHTATRGFGGWEGRYHWNRDSGAHSVLLAVARCCAFPDAISLLARRGALRMQVQQEDAHADAHAASHGEEAAAGR